MNIDKEIERACAAHDRFRAKFHLAGVWDGVRVYRDDKGTQLSASEVREQVKASKDRMKARIKKAFGSA